MYGYNKTLIRINSDEEVRDLFRFIKDAKSRIKSPILCIVLIGLVATLYMIVTLFIGSIAISLVSNMGNNPTITRTLSIFTAFVSIFITLPFTPSFLINILGGLSGMSKEKFLIAILIGKLFEIIH